MEDAPRARRPDPLAWGVFAALAAVYRRGRCPSYGPGGSAAVVARAVFAPGRDPLARLGRALATLPGDSPEGWINFVSGLLHAGAAAVLFATLRRIGLRRAPALAAALLLAFQPRFWYRALTAGREPAALLGLALAVWSVFAWKEEAKPWPLALGAAGALLGGVYAPRAETLAPLVLWLAAGAFGLLLQRLDGREPGRAAAVLAAALLVPLARPYDLRFHNPTREWALAALDSARDAECVVIADPGLSAAFDYESRRAGRALRAADRPCTRPLFDPLVRPPCRATKPLGVLLECGENGPAGEAAERARRAMAFPALGSVGKRDRAKYPFAGEDGLYERYAAALKAHRAGLEPGDAELRAKLDAQLADYEP